ncbi:hypothetical protein [Candidatus Scalindua japonica]|uniref:hypothetical protein n=1 Tax=Candidatus Scalindua japonica TaxID=1284222 RepID=UPI003B96786C
MLVYPEQITLAEKHISGLGYKCQDKRFENSRDFYYEDTFYNQSNKKKLIY